MTSTPAPTIDPKIQFVAIPDDNYQPHDGKLMWMVWARHTENRGAILGSCLVMNGPSHSRIMSIYVPPQIRKCGIGSGLLRFACQTVVPESNDIYVEADSFEMTKSQGGEGPIVSDEKLRQFYQKHGFIPVLSHPFSLVRRAGTPKS